MDNVTPIHPGVRVNEILNASAAAAVASKALEQSTAALRQVMAALEAANSELCIERAENAILRARLQRLGQPKLCEEAAHE